jgi:hypothetical protein
MLLRENIPLDAPLTVQSFDLIQPTGKFDQNSDDLSIRPFQIWGNSYFPYVIAERDNHEGHNIKVIYVTKKNHKLPVMLALMLKCFLCSPSG